MPERQRPRDLYEAKTSPAPSSGSTVEHGGHFPCESGRTMRMQKARWRESSGQTNGAKVKRSRRGGRRPQGSHGGHMNHGSGGGGGGGSVHNPNRTFDSNGPEVKVRGSASHVFENYLQLARDANSAGDRVMAENYLQHAEHYFRIMAAQQAQMQQYQQQQQQQQQQVQANGNGQPRLNSGDQSYIQQPAQSGSAPSFSLNEAGMAEEDEEGQEAGAE